MQNHFGVTAREAGAVVVMRVSAGQRLAGDDLRNLIAHLVVLGDLTQAEVEAACAELEAELSGSGVLAAAAPAPPPPPPPPPPPVSRRAQAAQAAQSAAAKTQRADET